MNEKNLFLDYNSLININIAGVNRKIQPKSETKLPGDFFVIYGLPILWNPPK